MNKGTIPIILAIFSISILMMFDSIVKPSYAQVVTNSDVNFGGANNKIFAMESFNLFVGVANGGNTLSWVRSDIVGAIPLSMTIKPQVGGCNPLDNPCGDNSAGLAIFDPINDASPIWAGTAQGLWCGITDCFTWWKSDTNGAGTPHQLLRYSYSSSGAGSFSLTGYMNVSSATNTNILPVITGIDTNTGGIGGITVNTVRFSGSTYKVYWTGGTSLMGDVGTAYDRGSGTAPVAMKAIHPLQDGSTLNRLAVESNGGAITNDFTIVNYSTHVEVCDVNLTPTSQGIVYDSTRDQFIVAVTTTLINSYDMTCGSTTRINSGLTAQVSGLAIDADTNRFYVMHGSTVTAPSVTQYNLATFATSNFDSTAGATISGWVTGNTAPSQNIALDTEHHSLAVSGKGSGIRIIYLTDFTEGEVSGGGINCDLPENANILICRLGGTGSLGSAGNFVIGNTTTGTGLLGLSCGVGIVDCVSDPNPQTNGLGLLIFIASIFVVVGMFITTHGAEKTFHLPVYMWAIIIIALSAFFTITHLIDPVFLIISILGLIALGAPKFANMFKGASTFGSGSTE